MTKHFFLISELEKIYNTHFPSSRVKLLIILLPMAILLIASRYSHVRKDLRVLAVVPKIVEME